MHIITQLVMEAVGDNDDSAEDDTISIIKTDSSLIKW